MKKALLTLVTVLGASLSALAGTDFNSLIVQNTKAQNELHDQIKSNVDEIKIAVQDGAKTFSIAAEAIHINTDKKFLTFAKEKKHYKASDAKSQKRLAEEFQNLE